MLCQYEPIVSDVGVMISISASQPTNYDFPINFYYQYLVAWLHFVAIQQASDK